ncbi:MAG: hypothetical protein K9M07_01885 [Simkaniaceae bacterium]|nr:hypothetical protein [Simkaniaceae bacterium]
MRQPFAIILTLFSTGIFAAPTAIDGITPQLKKEFDEKAAMMGAQQSSGKTGLQEVMIIDPQMRAKDFKTAYDILSTQNMKEHVTFYLSDKTVLSGIIGVDVLPGGTMMSFKLNTTQGIKYKVIPIEQISSVGK